MGENERRRNFRKGLAAVFVKQRKEAANGSGAENLPARERERE